MPHLPRTLAASLLATACAIAALAAPAGALVPGRAELVDRPDGFGPLPFDGASGATLDRHAVSADGRYVAFSSTNDALLDGDDDRSGHVYRLDRATGSLVQVDTAADGTQPTPSTIDDAASISADGRYVAFHSVSLTPAFTPGAQSAVYVKDLQTGTLTLASRATGADGAPADSGYDATLSGDGRHVAFVATGALHTTNVDGVPGGTGDIFVRDLDAQTTTMASVKDDGTRGGGIDGTLAIGIDFAGHAVAIVTQTAMVAGDVSGDYDAYLRTLGANGRTVLISGVGTLRNATSADLSADGARAAVQDVNGTIALVPLAGGSPGAPVTVSVPRSGAPGGFAHDPVFEPVASAATPEARVAFLTVDAYDPSDANARTDLYTADLAHAGDSSYVQLATSGRADGNVVSAASAGTTVVFQAAATNLPGGNGTVGQVYLRAGGDDVVLSQRGTPRADETQDASLLSVTTRSVDGDGQVVAFQGAGSAYGSPPLVTRDGHAPYQALVRHLDSGRTENASATPGGATSNGDASSPAIDDAGDRVAFVSAATDLGITTTVARHAYVRDLRTGALTLIDRTAGGTPLPGGVSRVALSADGTHAVYASGSTGRPGIPDTAIGAHLVVVDLRDGSTQVGDRASDGTLANQEVAGFALDADGTRIAFVSPATNLGTGDPGGRRQAYVRDLATGRTVWASRPQDGDVAHASVDSRVAVDAAGRRVAFTQSNPAFGFGMVPGTAQVFVADLAGGTTSLAALDANGRPFDRTDTPSLSADGTKVSFNSGSASEPSHRQVWWRDLAAGATVLASATPGGAPTGGLPATSMLSSDGRCVVFTASATDLVPGGYGPDLDHIYRSCPTEPPPGGGGGGGGGGAGPVGGGGSRTVPPARDRVAPVLSRVKLTRTRFAVGTGRAHRGHPARGTAFTFTLSEDATVRLAITHGVAGRRAGRRCVAPRRGLTRRCTRTVTVLQLSRRLKRGATRLVFNGRVGRTSLRPGSYRATLVARDAAGNASRTVTLAFRVVAA